MPYYKTPNNLVAWLDAGQSADLLPNGSTPITQEQADAMRQPVETEAQIVDTFTAAIQSRLDAFARTEKFDGILSACSYVTSSVPRFAAQAAYCVSARDSTWATGYAIMDAVMSGQRPMPTIEDVMAELPPLEWPQ